MSISDLHPTDRRIFNILANLHLRGIWISADELAEAMELSVGYTQRRLNGLTKQKALRTRTGTYGKREYSVNPFWRKANTLVPPTKEGEDDAGEGT